MQILFHVFCYFLLFYPNLFS